MILFARHAFESLESCLFQSLPVVRMSNINQSTGPLSHIFAPHFSYSVLCHNIVYMSSRSHYSSSRQKIWHNLRFSFSRPGWKCQNRLAMTIFCCGCCCYEVNLATKSLISLYRKFRQDTRVEGRTNGIRDNLACQVNFESRVDGRHLALFTDRIHMICPSTTRKI